MVFYRLSRFQHPVDHETVSYPVHNFITAEPEEEFLLQQQQYTWQLSNMLKSLAYNHWAKESVHWQQIHSPNLILSWWGLKRKFYLRICKNVPVINSILYFHNITESGAAGKKKMTENSNYCFAPSSTNKPFFLLGPIDTQLCISSVMANVIKTVLNPSLMH